MAFTTNAGNKFAASVTEWLQDTRLLSEAAHRLHADFKNDGKIDFSPNSWPKPPRGETSTPMEAFRIQRAPLKQRMNSLSNSLWQSRFVFLETLWEEYLQELVLELRHMDASVFEPFCEKEFMAGIVREVLSGNLQTIEEIKDEAAARFATGITRQPWKDQWKQLERLQIGLSKADEKLHWFSEIDIYFEMRNCIIHQQGRVSSLLKQKSAYYREKGTTSIDIRPQHLDFYRRRFLDLIKHIETKIAAKFCRSTDTATLSAQRKPLQADLLPDTTGTS